MPLIRRDDMMQEFNPTDRDLISWASYQRVKHKNGLLELSRKKKLEGILGWHWGKNFKQESLNQCHEVFQRAQKRGRLPKQISKDPQERYDATWISLRKTAKLGKSRSLWLDQFDEITKIYGFHNVFNIRDSKQETLQRCHEVLKRAQERGSLPKENSKDPQERHDAEWIQNIKRRKRKLYRELKKIATQYGFSDAFDKKR